MTCGAFVIAVGLIGGGYEQSGFIIVIVIIIIIEINIVIIVG